MKKRLFIRSTCADVDDDDDDNNNNNRCTDTMTEIKQNLRHQLPNNIYTIKCPSAPLSEAYYWVI